MQCIISAPSSLYLLSSLHCLADVTHAVWSNSGQRVHGCFFCNASPPACLDLHALLLDLFVPCPHRAVVWTCGRKFGALCHPLQLETAGQTVPASRLDRCNESTGTSLGRPQLIPPFNSNISQMSGVHLIPLCNERESLFIHIIYNSGKFWFVNLTNMFQGLINNDCLWSFHLCDCLLSAWI